MSSQSLAALLTSWCHTDVVFSSCVRTNSVNKHTYVVSVAARVTERVFDFLFGNALEYS